MFIYPSSYIVFVFLKCTCSGLIDILIQAQVLILWGFLNTLIKFLSTVRVWMGGIVGKLIFKIEISPHGVFYITLLLYIFEMGAGNGLNGGTVDRHGLILWENGATGSRKVSRCLRGLWDAIF